MIYLVAGLLAVCVSFQVITFIEMGKLNHELEIIRFAQGYAREIADAPVETPDVPEIADEPMNSIDASELTDTELLIIEREAEFDLRIAKMKEELAFQQTARKHNPTEAVSLHPLVQNLPHNIIMDTYDSLPDVEYTR